MPTLAFLGATGGCVGHCLAHALQSGQYNCRALARTPSKLTASLASKGVNPDALARLTIIPGDAKDIEAVKKLLTPEDNSTVSAIVSGIGSTPVLQWSWMPVTIADPTLCTTTMKTLFAALAALESTGMTRPDVVAVSTTGITSGPRDVPFLLVPLYHWLLHAPHQDKRDMEKMLWDETKKVAKERVTRRFVIVRPTLLTDGKSGLAKVRWGWEGRPAVGYTIGRPDVGQWIFEYALQEGLEGKGSVGKDVAVTLTY